MLTQGMSSQGQKCFVGGLSWETTDEKLRRYFENYGAVAEAFVSYDRHTGRPRGFGFVVFEDPSVADKVVSLQHTIDRREVEAKKAVPKEDHASIRPAIGVGGQRTKKVFVGGLAPSVDEVAFRQYFEQFGAVEDAVVMYDHDNKRPRGFGFVTFTTEEAVDNVFTQGTLQTLHDKQIEIKRAVPRDQMPALRAGGSPRAAPSAFMGYGRGAFAVQGPRAPAFAGTQAFRAGGYGTPGLVGQQPVSALNTLGLNTNVLGRLGSEPGSGLNLSAAGLAGLGGSNHLPGVGVTGLNQASLSQGPIGTGLNLGGVQAITAQMAANLGLGGQQGSGLTSSMASSMGLGNGFSLNNSISNLQGSLGNTPTSLQSSVEQANPFSQQFSGSLGAQTSSYVGGSPTSYADSALLSGAVGTPHVGSLGRELGTSAFTSSYTDSALGSANWS